MPAIQSRLTAKLYPKEMIGSCAHMQSKSKGYIHSVQHLRRWTHLAHCERSCSNDLSQLAHCTTVHALNSLLLCSSTPMLLCSADRETSSTVTGPGIVVAYLFAFFLLTRPGLPPPKGLLRAKSMCFWLSTRTMKEGTFTICLPTLHTLQY